MTTAVDLSAAPVVVETFADLPAPTVPCVARTADDGGTLWVPGPGGSSWLQAAAPVQYGQDVPIEFNGVMIPKENTPVSANTPGFSGSWTFPAAGFSSVIATQQLPPWWLTYNVDFIWTVTTATSGDVRLQYAPFWTADGDDLSATGSIANISVVDTVPATNIRHPTRIASGVATVAGKTHTFRCRRDGDNAADTCTAAIAFIRPVFSRAS